MAGNRGRGPRSEGLGGDDSSQPEDGDGGSGGGIELPWKPTTRQEVGRQEEVRILKLRGARPHPGSGSGNIKEDGSDEATLYQVKTVGRSISLTAKDIQTLWLNAIHTGKEARVVIYFDQLDLTLEGVVRPGR